MDKLDKIAADLTFEQLNILIGKTVQLGWEEFKESYSNEVGDFENYKDVYIEGLTEDFDCLEELNENKDQT